MRSAVARQPAPREDYAFGELDTWVGGSEGARSAAWEKPLLLARSRILEARGEARGAVRSFAALPYWSYSGYSKGNYVKNGFCTL